MVTIRTYKGIMTAHGDGYFEMHMKMVVCDPSKFKSMPSKEKTMRFVSIGNYVLKSEIGLNLCLWEGYTITFT